MRIPTERLRALRDQYAGHRDRTRKVAPPPVLHRLDEQISILDELIEAREDLGDADLCPAAGEAKTI